jgi:flagellar biosynthesis/type III secretory pathway protein FliH
MPSEQEQAQKLADNAQELINKMRDEAFRQGWARGYEKGFSAGVEAAGVAKPKVRLTDD